MNKENLRMQMLSGIITEGEYKTKLTEGKSSDKQQLDENFVGIGAINNPFIEREKTGYEMAFEHYLGNKITEEVEVEENQIEEVSKGNDVEKIEGVLSSQRFSDWYENDYNNYIEGTNDAKSTNEIYNDIKTLFNL